MLTYQAFLFITALFIYWLNAVDIFLINCARADYTLKPNKENFILKKIPDFLSLSELKSITGLNRHGKLCSPFLFSYAKSRKKNGGGFLLQGYIRAVYEAYCK